MRAELTSQIERLETNKLTAAELPPEKHEEIRSQLRALGYIQ